MTGDDAFVERFGVGDNICRTHFLIDGLYILLGTSSFAEGRVSTTLVAVNICYVGGNILSLAANICGELNLVLILVRLLRRIFGRRGRCGR